MLQKPFRDKLDRSQQLDIITPLGVDEMAKWCNSFVLVPKPNGKVRLCLDPAWFNQALLRPIHRGPTLNDILPELNNVRYLSLIDASCGFHNLKLDVGVQSATKVQRSLSQIKRSVISDAYPIHSYEK